MQCSHFHNSSSGLASIWHAARQESSASDQPPSPFSVQHQELMRIRQQSSSTMLPGKFMSPGCWQCSRASCETRRYDQVLPRAAMRLDVSQGAPLNQAHSGVGAEVRPAGPAGARPRPRSPRPLGPDLPPRLGKPSPRPRPPGALPPGLPPDPRPLNTPADLRHYWAFKARWRRLMRRFMHVADLAAPSAPAYTSWLLDKLQLQVCLDTSHEGEQCCPYRPPAPPPPPPLPPLHTPILNKIQLQGCLDEFHKAEQCSPPPPPPLYPSHTPVLDELQLQGCLNAFHEAEQCCPHTSTPPPPPLPPRSE